MPEEITYVYVPPLFAGTVGKLIRSIDQAAIPCVLDNKDYQQFLAWIDAGNPPPPGWTGPINPKPLSKEQ